MGLPVFLFEMGSGQFSSEGKNNYLYQTNLKIFEGPIGLWKICPLFQGEKYIFSRNWQGKLFFFVLKKKIIFEI